MYTAPLLTIAGAKRRDMGFLTAPSTKSMPSKLLSQASSIRTSSPLNFTKLPALLARLKESEPKTQLLLRADGSRTYNDVIELMALIRRAGFQDVSLVTQAEGK